MEALIREILRGHADISVPVDRLASDTNLYDAGLSSFGSVEVMVALEEHFGAPMPERLLRRSTFESIAALCDAAEELRRLVTAA